MPKVSNSFTNPFADVDMQPVQVAGQDVAKIAVRVKDDTGEYTVAGILGKDYQVYKNSMARDVASDIMTRSNKEWTNLKTLWDGKKYVDYFYTKDPITSIKNGMTYPLHLGMMLRNSYDGSSKFGFEFFIMNMICANQYVSRKQLGYFAVRHTGENQIDVEDALQNLSIGTTRMIEIAPRIENFISKPLAIADLVSAQAADIIPGSQWGAAIETLGKEADAGTVFGLFQAMTWVTSHKLSGMNSISQGDGVTEYFFNKYNS